MSKNDRCIPAGLDRCVKLLHKCPEVAVVEAGFCDKGITGSAPGYPVEIGPDSMLPLCIITVSLAVKQHEQGTELICL